MQTRGRELPGSQNAALLSSIFHEQASRWADIATDHVNQVSALVTDFVRGALEHVIDDQQLRRQVFGILRSRLESNEGEAHRELRKLLDDEKGSPVTYNHYYTDNIQKSRLDQMRGQLQTIHESVVAERGKFHVSNTPEDIDQLVASCQRHVQVNMDEQACSEALTALDAYYKVSCLVLCNRC